MNAGGGGRGGQAPVEEEVDAQALGSDPGGRAFARDGGPEPLADPEPCRRGRKVQVEPRDERPRVRPLQPVDRDGSAVDHRRHLHHLAVEVGVRRVVIQAHEDPGGEVRGAKGPVIRTSGPGAGSFVARTAVPVSKIVSSVRRTWRSLPEWTRFPNLSIFWTWTKISVVG